MNDGRLRAWIRSPLLGALIGLPVLGGGGRLAMRVIAAATDAPSAVTAERTITVLLAGAGSGAVAGAIYQGLATLLPARRLPRDLAFALMLALLTLRGLNPVRPLPLALFGALMAVFTALFLAAWPRAGARSRRADAGGLWQPET